MSANLSYLCDTKGECFHLAVSAELCSDEGAVKLVNGSTANEGRVEICLYGQWSTACGSSWGLPEARVTCREQGFNCT